MNAPTSFEEAQRLVLLLAHNLSETGHRDNAASAVLDLVRAVVRDEARKRSGYWCPACDGPVTYDGRTLECRNPACTPAMKAAAKAMVRE